MEENERRVIACVFYHDVFIYVSVCAIIGTGKQSVKKEIVMNICFQGRLHCFKQVQAKYRTVIMLLHCVSVSVDNIFQ